MNIVKIIAEELNVKEWQVEKTMALIDEGNTIPFISRYRKEATGSLNDEQLRSLDERLTYLRNLDEKKTQVMATIEEQGKLTDELKKQLEEAMTLVAVEDLYRPYRPKRRTKATIAKEKGLEGLANIIALQMTKKTILEEAEAYISEEKEVASAEEAIEGAKDILAENYADDAEYRTRIRELTRNKGKLISQAKDKEAKSVYEMYYDFEEDVKKAVGYRVLAINRGEAEKVLTVKIEAPTPDI
ncbi:MAG: RNA-binding transcriptional accessory protein, partial [Lachnospiraceae bacterium]|nr:RNA-binding transcriptional accessory protein [Lachnospiraceae bacterium]